MAISFTGYWVLDAIDLWDGFHVAIQKGSTDLLRLPPQKAPQAYNWQGEDGVESDTSAPKLDARDITLQCWISADNRAAFFDFHDALISQLMLPGLHSLRVASHGLDRAYYLQYKSSTFTTVKALALAGDEFTAYQFNLNLYEPQPQIGVPTYRIIDEQNRFIVT